MFVLKAKSVNRKLIAAIALAPLILIFLIAITVIAVNWLVKTKPVEQTAWGFKNEKMVVIVLAKKKPWAPEDAQILGYALGLDANKESWYIAIVKNLSPDEAILFDVKNFVVLLNNKIELKARELKFDLVKYNDLKKNLLSHHAKYERLIELKNLIESYEILPEEKRFCAFIFEKKARDTDIDKMYYNHLNESYSFDEQLVKFDAL